MENSLITTNEGIKDLTISNVKVKEKIRQYWDREYVQTKLDNIQNAKHAVLFRVMWYTGARVSAIILLRKRDIDLNSYLIRIRWLKSRT